MTVDHILRTKGTAVVTAPPDTSLSKAATLLREHRIGAIVVSRDGSRIDGILSERDIVAALARDGAAALDANVATAMTAEVVTCSRRESVQELMSVMTDRRIRHLPVADDTGALAGMISIGDVVKARLAEVEAEAAALRDYIATA